MVPYGYKEVFLKGLDLNVEPQHSADGILGRRSATPGHGPGFRNASFLALKIQGLGFRV